MRICFVSREVGGVRGGGIGTYVAEAGRALTAAGHEVWLLTEKDGLDGAQLRALAQLEGFHRVVPIAATGRSRWFHANTRYGHAMLVHEALLGCGARFDYVEFADYHAEGLIALREQRLHRAHGDAVMAVNLHTPSYECYRWNHWLHLASEGEWETFALEDAAIRDAPYLHAPSAAMRDAVCERLGLPAESVAIVPYPMRAAPAAPLSAKSDLSAVDFLYFGRIEPRKGVTELVEAFARMPRLRLRLIGGDTPFAPLGGSYREWLQRRAPSNVTFVDALPRAALLADIRTADVCILPSRFENWPNACLEAMQAGRVVIGSRHGGMAQMIEPGVSGFLADGRDAGDIVRVIEEELAARLPCLPDIGAAASVRANTLADPRCYARTIEDLVAARRRETRLPAQPRSEPSVTVVVPFHRDAATIDRAIDSAIAQDHRELEILIVDDGSPHPDVAAILERQRRKDPRVRTLSKPNGGLASARNHGITQATGECVLFLDADNALCPDYARLAAGVLAREPSLGFVVPHVLFLRSDGSEHGIYNPLPFRRELALLMNRFGDAGACFRRRVFADSGVHYDERFASFEDWALWLALDRAGVRGTCIPRVLYHYHERADSMLRTDGWRNLHASVGLMIADHLAVPDEATRDCWFGLLQSWGRVAQDSEVQSRFGAGAAAIEQLNQRLEAAYLDHAGTMANRDTLARRCAELLAERDAARAELAALRPSIAPATSPPT
jgi:glycosyltransferase involved in cell wall biosynthesis/GT2 family glycosyltransferase